MPKFNRKITIFIIAILAFALIAGCGKKAEEGGKAAPEAGKQASEVKFPERPITIIVPFKAGGGTDAIARKIASMLEPKGIAVVVVNKEGGGANIGFTEASKAKPDGYTLAFNTANMAINNAMGLSQLSYKDFEPIIAVNTEAGMITVRKDSKYKTIQDLINDAKANPGKVKIGVGSAGSPWVMGLSKLKDKVKIDFTIAVASGGGAEVASNLLGGHIDAACHAPADFAGLMKAGDLRPLAVLGDERNPDFPDAPTLKELGYDVTQFGPRGFIAPKGTPKEIVQKLHDIFKEVIDTPEYKDFMKKQVTEFWYLNSADYTKFLEDEQKTYTELAEKFNLKKQ